MQAKVVEVVVVRSSAPWSPCCRKSLTSLRRSGSPLRLSIGSWRTSVEGVRLSLGLNQVLDVDRIICLEIRNIFDLFIKYISGASRPCRNTIKLFADADKPWQDDKMR